ncbi:hypothetical protein Clacol_006887 [Clathrus columnatus]|uniref:Fork-head domain-containing protein n=1 Tax=Clathrus columnatus TaxID=1419009 RepID=A0AAV5ADC8_9AGAM|nr:hypothetical protein Clacol_006887 [Clathrus columnatus]
MSFTSLDTRNPPKLQDDDDTMRDDLYSELDRESATASKIHPMSIKLEEKYASISRKLHMSKVKNTYCVLFPFWLCDCAFVPRDIGQKKLQLASQYYPLRYQQQEWKHWQRANPCETDPGGEISLNAIEWHSPDAHDVPPFHLWYLILAAIHGSPMKRLTENEIKLCLMRRFAYFFFRQSNEPDDTDAWIINVSTELRNNSYFIQSDVIKQDRDDSVRMPSNCIHEKFRITDWITLTIIQNPYWTITQLPLDISVFHPQCQLLQSILNSQRSVGTSRNRPTPLETLRELTNTDTSSPIRPKIPISMLIHPNNVDPIEVYHKPLVITAEMIESWTWLQ